MEWVEVTGKSVDEAKEAALEQLGVAERDAELIVVAEPKTGLFGRVRGEARVRARVQPVGPRPKRTRRSRDRGGRPDEGSGGARGGRGADGGRGAAGGRGGRQDGRGSGENGSGRHRSAAATGPGDDDGAGHGTAPQGPSDAAGQPPDGGPRVAGQRAGGQSAGTSRSARRRRSRAAAKMAGGAGGGAGGGGNGGSGQDNGSGQNGTREGATGRPTSSVTKEEADMAEGMTLEEQAEVARGFLQGLLASYGLDAAVETRVLDDDTVEIAATGDGLGILVGPKGATLSALQDVTRTVVQRQFPSKTDRILVDVAGYREKRAAALRRFSEQVAAEVVETGSERALEPMSPADRKVVHDSLKDNAGVVTRSEGEDPSRYIVIAPAG
ncbi:MAG TPA: RNA-binding cell elongation regulator Jag/EloR [Acidimicrobiales bacterium]|nr:RNA-binding cell elongation regulator Jag/EloR [Acidimicrobiales bacterium]